MTNYFQIVYSIENVSFAKHSVKFAHECLASLNGISCVLVLFILMILFFLLELVFKMIRKSTSCQLYPNVNSTSSDVSSSSSENDTPLKKFNRLVLWSVARRWAYFKNDRPPLWVRGRSVSDSGLSVVINNELVYCDIHGQQTRSLQAFGGAPGLPTLSVTSAGGSGSVAGDDASDGSDAERPRRGHHLRVPTPALPSQSTGNFASGAAGGGCGAPRSAPATPLQLEPQPQPRTKHDKQVLKPLSGSAPSVRAAALSPHTETTDGKQPSKARQKKFNRHFPQVGPEEKVLNYYSCALVGDLLLQGHLYITKNYFAFYSNVFGYVTKLLIPTTSVLRITKEKVARIIPNAVGVCTRDERHVFGSLLSRDSTYKLMLHVWKAARAPELAVPKPQDRLASEVELDASEYSPEDDSSSAGGDHVDAPTPPPRRESEAIIPPGAAVIQPALLTGGTVPRHAHSGGGWARTLVVLAALLAASAAWMAYRLYRARAPEEDLSKLSGEELYSELVQWRARLHGRAAGELHAFLSTNLLLLTKVRQSLEALSGVILADMAQRAADAPTDTAFS